MEGHLSQPINEALGCVQGKCTSSDHYKVYVNPSLVNLDESHLGYWIGPICVSTTAVADDIYLQTEVPSNLQHLMNMASKSGKQYRIIYGATKTKIVVTGSKIDMEYYRETSPWTMDGALSLIHI